MDGGWWVVGGCWVLGGGWWVVGGQVGGGWVMGDGWWVMDGGWSGFRWKILCVIFPSPHHFTSYHITMRPIIHPIIRTITGGASLHSCCSAHGPDATTFTKASNANLGPVKFDKGLVSARGVGVR